MRKAGVRALLLAVSFATGFTSAAPRTVDPATLLGGNDPAELSTAIRTILLSFLPEPLYEDHKHWGGQKEVVRGIKWTGDGLDFHPEPQRSLKNDGLWWRVKVTAPEVEKTLLFEIREIEKPEPGKMTFTALVSFNTDINYDRQRWDAGHRILSTSIRGRARVNLTLNCEAVTRVEPGKIFSDTVFRLRVVSSNFSYDDVKFEHVAGLGGDAAKAIGDVALASLHIWKPSLEHRLVEKANKAILKAGDTKEVRVGLGKIFESKKK
jgi:hypothetical protein